MDDDGCDGDAADDATCDDDGNDDAAESIPFIVLVVYWRHAP